MALYFAIPFGVFTITKLLQRGGSKFELAGYMLVRVIILILIFVGTLAVLWIPLISSMGLFPSIEAVFSRIFPIRRGIFEDKVSSFWCVLHNFYKVNTLWSRPTQVTITTLVTLVACIPSCLMLLIKGTKQQFILALMNVSMMFFLFSF